MYSIGSIGLFSSMKSLLKDKKVWLGATVTTLAITGFTWYYCTNVYDTEGKVTLSGQTGPQPTKVSRKWDLVRVTTNIPTGNHRVAEVTYSINLKTKQVGVFANTGSMRVASEKAGYIERVEGETYYVKFYDSGTGVFFKE